MRAEEPNETHLSNGEFAGYLDKTLPADKREEVERHLADCGQCRDDLMEVARALRTRRPHRIRYIAPPVLAVAAVITLIAVNPWGSDSPGRILRDTESSPRVIAVAPVDGDQLTGEALTFVWRPLNRESRYRFTLTDTEGAEIWTGDLTDTVLALPNETNLSRGETYFWYVDVLLLDGRSATTGVQSFQLPP